MAAAEVVGHVMVEVISITRIAIMMMHVPHVMEAAVALTAEVLDDCKTQEQVRVSRRG